MKNNDLRLLLQKDIVAINDEFNADYAKLLVECFGDASSFDDFFIAEQLKNNFFDLYQAGENGKKIVLDFIAAYLNYDDDIGSGSVYSGKIPVLVQSKEYGIELLQDIFLDNRLSKTSVEAFIGSIICLAANNPEKYISLVPSILKCASEDFFLRGWFEEICSRSDSEKEKEYLITHLGFQPITMYPKLVDGDIEGVDPIINVILKNIRTNFVDFNKQNLIEILVEKLPILITNNPEIAQILTIAGKQAAIHIAIKDGMEFCGGVYLPSSKSIFVYVDPVSVDNNLTQVTHILVYESTHCFIDYAYQNYSQPFRQGNDMAEQYHESLAKKIASDLKKSGNIAEDALKLGFNEFKLMNYSEEQYISEIPAYFIEEIAIRLLRDPSAMRESILLKYPIMKNIESAFIASHDNEVNAEAKVVLVGILPESVMELIGLYTESVELYLEF